jgi:hypothetical protein
MTPKSMSEVCSMETPPFIGAPCKPLLNTETSRWLSCECAADPIDVRGNFLRLGSSHKEFLHNGLKGRVIGKTAHGVLSSADALRVLPKGIDEVRAAMTYRLYECRRWLRVQND